MNEAQADAQQAVVSSWALLSVFGTSSNKR